jgi:hypothetical protein
MSKERSLVDRKDDADLSGPDGIVSIRSKRPGCTSDALHDECNDVLRAIIIHNRVDKV